MRGNWLRQAWGSGKVTLGGWLSLPSAFSAEVMAHAGFHWLCVDMQHGLIGYQEMVAMLQAISTTEVTPLVRVPRNEPAIIGRALDAGARGVIIPMVNSQAEAEAAVAACRYGPQGWRSHGPLRANYYVGPGYVAHADADVICIVMIETAQAVGSADEILSTPGVDAVYIGPADLSLSLGLPPARDQGAPAFTDAIDVVLASCARHDVVPGIAANAAVAPERIGQGFRFVEVANDVALLTQGATKVLTDLASRQVDTAPASR